MWLLSNSSASDWALTEVMSGLLLRYKVVIDLWYFNDCTNVMTPSSLMESSLIHSFSNVVLFDNCNEMMLSFVNLVCSILIHVTVLIFNSCGNRNWTMCDDELKSLTQSWLFSFSLLITSWHWGNDGLVRTAPLLPHFTSPVSSPNSKHNSLIVGILYDVCDVIYVMSSADTLSSVHTSTGPWE